MQAIIPLQSLMAEYEEYIANTGRDTWHDEDNDEVAQINNAFISSSDDDDEE
ncbi:hypothetical protein TSAR_001987 [Trichomalopsis sarcophagae]|uniref:Uncharacterized protein n=1 Tax=Trichomalopsis sarcophagae TaxID=543379 RepID=A0A232ELD4_9HYME|nr:hypothetical protein TSAR_001987 [Trichomalopsis sarcophagae]